MKKSFIKAFLACFLFVLLSYFQNKDPIRENFEDISFDIISKIALSISEENTGSLVTIFTFDNAYMQNQNLFDENLNPNYGYFFPREKIAEFIDSLDQRLQSSENPNKRLYCPKALFIDFQLNFTTGADGQFSTGDHQLLNTLEKPRCFKILLAKGGKHNFIEESKNENIQKLIREQKIIFVSPFFHANSNNLVRRYEPIKKISGTLYPGAAIALWQIINNKKVNADQARRLSEN